MLRISNYPARILGTKSKNKNKRKREEPPILSDKYNFKFRTGMASNMICKIRIYVEFIAKQCLPLRNPNRIYFVYFQIIITSYSFRPLIFPNRRVIQRLELVKHCILHSCYLQVTTSTKKFYNYSFAIENILSKFSKISALAFQFLLNKSSEA